MRPSKTDIIEYYGYYINTTRTIRAMRADGFSFSDGHVRETIRELEEQNPSSRTATQQQRKRV